MDSDVISFSEGLTRFFSKGGNCYNVKPTRAGLDKLKSLVVECISNISVKYQDPSDGQEYLEMLNWVLHRINSRTGGRNTFIIRISRRIAIRYLFLHSDFRYEFEDDKELDDAYQWLFNKINKRWSVAELSLYPHPNKTVTVKEKK